MEENACLICFFKRTFASWVFAWVWQLFNWLFLLTRVLSTKCSGSWGKFKYQFYVLIKAAIPQAAINPAANFSLAPGSVLVEICPCPLLVAELTLSPWGHKGGICEDQRPGMGRGWKGLDLPPWVVCGHPALLARGKEPLEQGAEEIKQPLPHCLHFSLFLGFFPLSYVVSFPCSCACVFSLFWWKFKNLAARDREIEVWQCHQKNLASKSSRESWRPHGNLDCPSVSHLWRPLCWVSCWVDL